MEIQGEKRIKWKIHFTATSPAGGAARRTTAACARARSQGWDTRRGWSLASRGCSMRVWDLREADAEAAGRGPAPLPVEGGLR